MRRMHKRKCPYCSGRGYLRVNLETRERIRRFVGYITKNVHRGSVVLIGAHYRRILRVYPDGALRMPKVRASWTSSDDTIVTVYDYYRKFHGTWKGGADGRFIEYKAKGESR